MAGTAGAPAPPSPGRNASDDEILGLMTDGGRDRAEAGQQALEGDGKDIDAEKHGEVEEGDASVVEEKRREAMEAYPELRQAWEDAAEYREAFATPAEARQATALLADLERMYALFYSRSPEDHAELARSIAELDAAAFGSLATAIAEHRAKAERAGRDTERGAAAAAAAQHDSRSVSSAGLSPAQAEFFQAANAAAVQGVMDAIETQVERLLPEGVSMSNAGGSFSTGTYYVWVVSTTSGSCAGNSGMSAPSNIYGPLTVGPAVTTAEFNVTWTAAATGMTAIQGYCVFVNIAKAYNSNSPSSNLFAGASTTSGTVTAAPNSPGAYPITYQMVAQHHFAPGWAMFNGNVTPNVASSTPPYLPTCLAATCGAFIPLSPFVADSFTRADANSLGANWTINYSGSAMHILSNTAVAAAGNYSEASYAGQVFAADQFSKATISAVDGAAGLGVMVRMAAANVDTGYMYFCSTSIMRNISKRVAGVSTTLTTAGGTCAANDKIELDVVGTTIFAIYNGTVDLVATDSALTSGAPGIALWNAGTPSADSLANWYGGSLTVGNATASIFNQPNVWVGQQTFVSPIGSASLAVPNKTRTCSIVRGDQSGSALTTGTIQPQGSLCYVDAASTVAQVIVMVDAGASTVQVGYRHNGSTTTITPTLTPAAVGGVTDHVACANIGGTAATIEGNSVTCSTLTHSGLTAGDFIETIGGAADGTSKRMSIALTFTPN